MFVGRAALLWCAATIRRPSPLLRGILQVQRDYEELPAGAALSLRDSLLSLLVKHCQVGRGAEGGGGGGGPGRGAVAPGHRWRAGCLLQPAAASRTCSHITAPEHGVEGRQPAAPGCPPRFIPAGQRPGAHAAVPGCRGAGGAPAGRAVGSLRRRRLAGAAVGRGAAGSVAAVHAGAADGAAPGGRRAAGPGPLSRPLTATRCVCRWPAPAWPPAAAFTALLSTLRPPVCLAGRVPACLPAWSPGWPSARLLVRSQQHVACCGQRQPCMSRSRTLPHAHAGCLAARRRRAATSRRCGPSGGGRWWTR